jgi:WD40 repeat protein
MGGLRKLKSPGQDHADTASCFPASPPPNLKEVMMESWKRPAALRIAAILSMACLICSLGSFRSMAAEPLPPEIVTQLGHTSGLSAVAFSPDGKMILTSSGNLTPALWDVASGREVRVFKGHTDGVIAFAFSPDGKKVLTGSSDHTARLWDVASGREIQQFKGHTYGISTVAFSPDGATIFTAGFLSDRTLRVWDAATGRQLGQFKVLPDGSVAPVVFSPDGKTVLSITAADDTAHILEARTGRELKRFKTHPSVRSATYSPDGKFLLTGSSDGTVSLLDAATGNEVRQFRAGSKSVHAVAFSPDGRMVAAAADASGDPIALIWNAADGQELQHVFSNTASHADSIAFSPDSTALLTGGSDRTTRIWNVKTGQQQQQFRGRTAEVDFVTYTQDGKSFVATSDDLIRIWDASTGRLTRQFKAPKGPRMTMAISPDGRQVLTADDDTARLVDTVTGRDLLRVKGHPDDTWILVFFPDGKTILTANSGDTVARIWDVATGRELRQIKGERGIYLFFAAVSPDGRTILTTSQDNAGKLWNAADGRYLRRLNNGRDGMNVAAFSPDGRLVVTGSYDDKVHLWETSTGRELQKITASELPALAFSPDSKTLLAAGVDVNLWDTASGKLSRQLIGHTDTAKSAGYSPDGRTIITGGADGTTRLWNAADGTPLASMISFTDGEWLTITPEGFFDASSPKAADNLNVVSGLDVYSIDQFRDALFRPDLVKAQLAGDPDGAVKAAAGRLNLNKVVASGSAPRVEIASPTDGSSIAAGEIAFTASVDAQDGGIGRIEWRLNGQPVGVATRGLERVPDKDAAAGATSRISQKITLDPGSNLVELVAYNASGLVASQPARIRITATGPAPTAKPRLFVLAVGVNDYYDGRLKLNFAAPDARSVAAAFEKAGKGLYDAVEATTVLDADATRSHMDGVFARLASRIRTSDVFVFFVAGHGRTLDGHYYFLPQDFRYVDESSYAASAISQEQWQKWISTIPARKSVLIYDTCESGSVASDGIAVASRGLQRVEEQGVAYQKLRDATGRTILAASTDTDPALEGYHGHGVFSYAVIEALEKAQTNASGLIEVTGLISYVDDKVPDISFQAFHKRQIPQNKMVGSNFAVANRIEAAFDTTPMTRSNSAAETSPPALPKPPSADADTLKKPTHVVVQAATIFDQGGGQGRVVLELPAGTLLSVVRTDQGWAFVAREGKPVGYVAADRLLQIQ